MSISFEVFTPPSMIKTCQEAAAFGHVLVKNQVSDWNETGGQTVLVRDEKTESAHYP